jgi:hypothetical protein
MKQHEAERALEILAKLGRLPRMKKGRRGWMVETVDERPRLGFDDYTTLIQALTPGTEPPPKEDF